jgi:AraC-like DNA-binding protein
MDFSSNHIDFSTIKGLPVYKEEMFRTPCMAERKIGLWVDRIGTGVARGRPSSLRRLGQYASVFIESCEGYFITEAMGKVRVQQPDVMVLLPEEPHMYFPRTSWKTKWIVWNGPDAVMLEKLGYVSKDQMVVRDDGGAVNNAFSDLSNIITREDLVAILQRKNIILQMLLALFGASKKNTSWNSSDYIVAKAAEFLTENCTADLSIPQIAARFNLSETHFRRLFQRYTGRSPREFITSLRISRAKQLLSLGKTTVTEVAGIVGYKDVFYFMRVFKKTTGFTPGKFASLNR